MVFQLQTLRMLFRPLVLVEIMATVPKMDRLLTFSLNPLVSLQLRRLPPLSRLYRCLHGCPRFHPHPHLRRVMCFQLLLILAQHPLETLMTAAVDD